MMKFIIKPRSIPGFVGGLLIVQAFSIFISVVLFGFLTIIFKDRAQLLVSFITLFLFLLVCYNEGWKQGSLYNHPLEKKNLFYWLRGFFAGIIASIPGFTLATLMYFDFIKTLEEQHGLISSIYRIMYLPLQFLFNFFDTSPSMYFLPVLIMPIACGFGYILGLKQFALSQVFVYELKKDKPNS